MKPASLSTRLITMFVSPSEVFDEVGPGPSNLANWRTPTLLVCFSTVCLLLFGPGRVGTNNLGEITDDSSPLAVQNWMFAGARPIVAALSVCASALFGSIWSAFVLWLISRVVLRARVRFEKILEIVGLTGIILVLGTIVTGLLIAVSGDPATRPSLSLFLGKLSPESRARQVLDAFNFFHVWATAVLAIGLSRLAGVAFKEAAFWVFGYWIVLRVGLIVVA